MTHDEHGTRGADPDGGTGASGGSDAGPAGSAGADSGAGAGAADPHAPEEVAAALIAGIGLLKRRLRSRPAADGELSTPERTALSRLNRLGPATSSELARTEQITPQAMGATLRSLEAAGLVERHPDPEDGRRKLLTVSEAGARVLRETRGAMTDLVTRVLAEDFEPDELARLASAAPLLARLAQGV